MENFIVSARKYRPDSFKTVVGQKSVTKTLKNAIVNNRLAHAYLFCGPRGVGKTSIARIFAKTINCFHLDDESEACNECESCKSFNEGRSFNIHEMDAASKNGVEDMHSIIEQVKIPPQIGKYSIYIIDEVHMLSASAFNAFLKTLEEPPAHAIFILATTEKHKILPTILSRCQVFDFNRINVTEATEHLKFVATQENIKFEENALHIIAQKADGGMRDALSIFDQIASYSENNITYKQTIENLNVLDYDYFFNIVDLSLKNKISELFLIYDEILQKGFDGQHFILGYSKHLRNLLVCKSPASVKLLDVGKDLKDRYLEQASLCALSFIFESLQILRRGEVDYRTSKEPRILVELMLYEIGLLTAKKKRGINASLFLCLPFSS